MTEVASHRGSCGGGPDRASVVLPRQAPGGPPPPAPPPRESSGTPNARRTGTIKRRSAPDRTRGGWRVRLKRYPSQEPPPGACRRRRSAGRPAKDRGHAAAAGATHLCRRVGAGVRRGGGWCHPPVPPRRGSGDCARPLRGRSVPGASQGRAPGGPRAREGRASRAAAEPGDAEMRVALFGSMLARRTRTALGRRQTGPCISRLE